MRILLCLGVIGLFSTDVRADGLDIDPPLPEAVSIRLAPGWDIASFLVLVDPVLPGMTVLDAIESRQTYLLDLPPGTNEDLVEAIFDDDYVLDPNNPVRPLVWSDLCYLAQAAESRTGSVYVTFQAPDAGNTFPRQYPADLLGLDSAHANSIGHGVTVAVLDTGVDDTHPVLAGRVLPSGFNFVSMSSDTRERSDGIDNDGDGRIDEAFGHGTFMSGLIVLTAPETNILPVVVLDDDGNSDDFRLAKGMYYAIDHGVEVINLSLGSTYDAEAVQDAIEEANSHGIMVVGAAGNAGTGNEDLQQYPATTGETLGVAAVNSADARAAFTNYNEELFISAPGASPSLVGGDPNLVDASTSILGPIPGGGYAWWEGTSLSTAFVSGTVALIRAQHPEWTWTACDGDSASPAEIPRKILSCIETVLESTALPINEPDGDVRQGMGVGRIDAAGAAALAGPAPTQGDLNHDGQVSIADLGLFLSDFGKVHSSADLDGSGHVGLVDLGLLLQHFGR